MLALRLFLVTFGVLLVFLVLAYSINRDRRWLKFAGLVGRAALATFLILGLLYLTRRLILL